MKMDLNTVVSMASAQFFFCSAIYKWVNYDHPGECSPEKDCLR